jgi:hypothetical protein
MAETAEPATVSNQDAPSRQQAEPNRLSGPTLMVATLLYAACVAVATYPAVKNFRAAFPAALPDPAMHLWVMRWTKACLLAGRSPVICPGLQYPVGAPLGHFSPMHLQSLLYIPLSFFIKNDVFVYNILWFAGFVGTGLGTFVLAWWLLRHRACAWFAGMVAMLSGPMMLHAHAHLELIYLGGFPLFLVAWMRLVDRPSGGRLAAAVGLYVLLTMGAAYYMVLAVFPAVLYVLSQAVRVGRREMGSWVWARVGWLSGFAALSLPVLVVLFANQLWASLHGHSMAREQSQFKWFVAPLWSYVVPTCLHPLGQILPCNVYDAAGYGPRIIESCSYIGFVVLWLLPAAAVPRARFPRSEYFWAALGMLVVLSLGPCVWIGPRRVNLPALALWKWFPPMQLTRNPARFNLLAAVCAAVLAAAGLRHLLERLRRPIGRVATFSGLTVLALGDLSVRSFPGVALPAMPPAYRFLIGREPNAAWIEVPMANSGSPLQLNALTGYWQSLHHGRTTGGYSGHDNETFDNLLFASSPFSAARLGDPNYLADPEHVTIGLTAGARFTDLAWLYLKTHGLRYAVLHQGPGAFPEFTVHTERLKPLLASALIFEDDRTAVYDRERLPRPARPIALPTRGWWQVKDLAGAPTWAVARTSRISVYNPDAGQPLRLSLSATAFFKPRVLQLRAGNQELARWTLDVVGPMKVGRQLFAQDLRSYQSPPFRLPAGLSELTLLCDGDDRPNRRRDTVAEGDFRPYSFLCQSLNLITADTPDPKPHAVAEGPGAVAR